MTETDLIRERYRLEREEILKNSEISESEKLQRISYSKASQEKELNDRLKNSTIEMARINAEMKGTGPLFEVSQTKASRYQANENWYDSETAVIDHKEGNELWASVFIGVITFFTTLYFKRRDDKRAQEIHELRKKQYEQTKERLKGDCDDK